MAWIEPKTNWESGHGVKSSDLNRIEGNIDMLNSAIELSLRDTIVLMGETVGNRTTYTPVYGNFIFNTEYTLLPDKSLYVDKMVITGVTSNSKIVLNVNDSTLEFSIPSTTGRQQLLVAAPIERIVQIQFVVTGRPAFTTMVFLSLYARLVAE